MPKGLNEADGGSGRYIEPGSGFAGCSGAGARTGPSSLGSSYVGRVAWPESAGFENDSYAQGSGSCALEPLTVCAKTGWTKTGAEAAIIAAARDARCERDRERLLAANDIVFYSCARDPENQESL